MMFLHNIVILVRFIKESRSVAPLQREDNYGFGESVCQTATSYTEPLHLDLIFTWQGAAIGDVFLSTAVVNHDRRIPLASFDKYGLGYAGTHPAANMASALQLKTGVVTSGENLLQQRRGSHLMKGDGGGGNGSHSMRAC